MSHMIDALARVMTHRLGELDRHILATSDPREVRRLHRLRRRLALMFRALIGRAPRNPGPR